jgi:hypothetical protein
MEFDLEVKPTGLAKVQGLSRLLTESNCKALRINFMNTHLENKQTEIIDKDSHVILNLT